MSETFYVKHSDKVSFVFLTKGTLYRKDYGLKFSSKEETLTIPVGMVSVILLGPGTNVTHAGLSLACKMKCMVLWVGENTTTLYAYCGTQDRSNANLLKQIRLYTKYKDKMALRLYSKRFKEEYNPKKFNLKKLMGMEGGRVKNKYIEYAKQFGIPWEGRKISGDWNTQTPYNRALSVGNSCLYGIVSSALQALGYSPSLGVIHEGNMMSLVFDIADVYKIDYVMPLAFKAASEKIVEIEEWIRIEMRKLIVENKFMIQIIEDIEGLLDEASYR
jgi:CRISPR-associated protein Cas1